MKHGMETETKSQAESTEILHARNIQPMAVNQKY